MVTWNEASGLKCVVLCAGRGTRTRFRFTLKVAKNEKPKLFSNLRKKPKQLFKVYEKPVLGWVVDFWKKYTNDPLINIDIHISEERDKEKDYCKFQFKDNGIGIPDSRKEIIFQEGNRKDKSVKGMGIGLSLVKKIIERYDGKIWVEDRIHGDYSKGSNFILLIPLAKSEEIREVSHRKG